MTRKVSKRSGYVFINGRREHRMVWKEAHGKIPLGWVVHHINCVRDDNRLENLVALPAWYHDQIHALMRQGVVYTKEDLMREYEVLKLDHERYLADLKDALAKVKQARKNLNKIGVPNVAIDKYLTKLGKQKEKPEKKAKTAKQYYGGKKKKRDKIRVSTEQERKEFYSKQEVADVKAILRSGGL